VAQSCASLIAHLRLRVAHAALGPQLLALLRQLCGPLAHERVADVRDAAREEGLQIGDVVR